MQVEERFWSKVDKSGECWLWTMPLDEEGYGRFSIKSKYTLAHRLSYLWYNGPLVKGLVIDHICHVRHCIRPSHLRQVTIQKNAENKKTATRSKSGVRGVTWHKATGKWRVLVGHNYKLVHGGMFTDLDEAAAAAQKLRESLHA